MNDPTPVLEELHKKIAGGVTGPIASALARRKFSRSAVAAWRQVLMDALKLLNKLDGGPR